MRHVLLKKAKYLLTLAFVFTAMIGALAQELSVTGRVVDENGEGLPGVTVVLKGTSTAAPTDAEGNYCIPVPNQVRQPLAERIAPLYPRQLYLHSAERENAPRGRGAQSYKQ